jgi:hypothetical protein
MAWGRIASPVHVLFLSFRMTFGRRFGFANTDHAVIFHSTDLTFLVESPG